MVLPLIIMDIAKLADIGVDAGSGRRRRHGGDRVAHVQSAIVREREWYGEEKRMGEAEECDDADESSGSVEEFNKRSLDGQVVHIMSHDLSVPFF